MIVRSRSQPQTRRTASPSAGSRGKAAIAWLLLCVPIPLFLLGTASPTAQLNTDELWPTLALTIYSGTHLAVHYGRGDLRIASVTFWLFVYVAMSIAVLAEISTGLHSYLEDASTLQEAVFITLVGCIAYDAAQVARSLKPRRKALAPTIHAIHFGRLNFIGVIGILGSVLYIRDVGLSNFFSSRTDIASGLAQGGLTDASGSQVASAAVGAAVVPLILAWLAWTARLSRDPASRTPGRWLWYLTMTAFVVIVNNPISSSRYQFLTVTLAAVFCLPNLGKKGMRFIIGGGVILAITVFPYSDYFRVPAAQRQPLQVNSIAVELSTKDYDQMTMIANGIWYANLFGHTDGGQLLSDALFFVPHTVWRGRATDTGVLLAEAMAVQGTNLSAPLWLEFWLDFSWLGLIVGFLAFGWISSRWDDLFVHLRRQRSSAPAVLDLALPLFAGFQFILLRGSILSSMGRMAVMVVLLLIVRGRPLTAEPAEDPLVDNTHSRTTASFEPSVTTRRRGR